MRHLLTLLLAAAVAAPALAQASPPRNQRVVVDTRNDVCTYTLPGSADAEAFEIAPLGRVKFQRRGPAIVSVTVKDASGVQGTQNGNSLVFKPNEGERELTARPAMETSTTHLIEIRCCTQRTGPTCAAWSGLATPSGTASARLAPPSDLAASGPSAADPTPSEPVLGPRMQVKE